MERGRGGLLYNSPTHAIAASGVLVQGESSIQRFWEKSIVSPFEEQEARSLQIFRGHQVRQQNPGRSSPPVHCRRTKVCFSPSSSVLPFNPGLPACEVGHLSRSLKPTSSRFWTGPRSILKRPTVGEMRREQVLSTRKSVGRSPSIGLSREQEHSLSSLYNSSVEAWQTVCKKGWWR
jgi:hypothetical protein